ncbi:uncharacterized protein TNCT_692381 [Trichonephila clavata]|uniref:Pao retrotransposon peptidase n=1 Tax=Trichonephila clavata TaxID=2740835 RepID=A0A8X6I2E1_TRICU|nr:uncharacterized protein TNCT_692381 [Trichonephila clavata]
MLGSHRSSRSRKSKRISLKWDTETDELYCVSPETDIGFNENISKRKLLSIVNSIYDPIGFTSPATLLPKLLLHEAWRNKLDWDEDLPSDLQLRYQRWAKHLNLFEKCRIPRRKFHGTIKQVTLHIFTDASAIGYACCAFLRCVEEDEVKVSFVSAKARVAPVQRPTIPRLELLGATIGARIASTILETLNSPLKTYFWTDSMTVLGWITNSEPWNTFVGNRVREIRELTTVDLSLEISIQQICLPVHVIGLNFSGVNGGRVQSGSTKVQNVGHTLRLLFHKKPC